MIRTVQRARHTFRNLRRFAQVMRVLARYGFEDFIRQLRLDYYFRWALRLFRRKPGPLEKRPANRPESFRLVLQELGPVFIKAGQILSTRPDVLPPEYLAEFRKLQDDVPPFEFDAVQEAFERENLSGSVEALVESIEPTPLAAASMAQVHAAVLRDGTEVVFKVQRPGLSKLIDTDLQILHDLAEFLARDEVMAELFDPIGIVQELARTLKREVDFRLEGQNIDRFELHFRDDESIAIPKVYWDLTSRRVLCMERIHGIKISDVTGLRAAGIDPGKVAKVGAQAILRMVLINGLYHADPHPGNVFVLEGGVICFLDYGIVGSIDEIVRDQLVRFLIAVVRRDPDRMIQVAREAGRISKTTDERALRHDVADFLDHYYEIRLGQLDVTQAVNDFLAVLHRHHVRFPPDLILLAKSLATMEGVAKELDPSFKLVEHARPFVTQAIKRRYSFNRLWREASGFGEDFFAMVRELPEDVMRILGLVKSNQLALGFRHEGLEEFAEEIDRSTNRLTMGLIVAALIVGSSIVVQADVGPKWQGLPVIGITGFVAAAFFGFGLGLAILRRGRL